MRSVFGLGKDDFLATFNSKLEDAAASMGQAGGWPVDDGEDDPDGLGKAHDVLEYGPQENVWIKYFEKRKIEAHQKTAGWVRAVEQAIGACTPAQAGLLKLRRCTH